MNPVEAVKAEMLASPLIADLNEISGSRDITELEKAEAKRHHFVSQFLLRGFSDGGNPARLYQVKGSAPGLVDTSSLRIGPQWKDVRHAESVSEGVP